MKRKPCLMLVTACFITVCARAQDNPDVVDKIANFHQKILAKINKRSKDIKGQLTRQAEMYLQRLSGQEQNYKRN
jgi:hypothetical protein